MKKADYFWPLLHGLFFWLILSFGCIAVMLLIGLVSTGSAHYALRLLELHLYSVAGASGLGSGLAVVGDWLLTYRGAHGEVE